jgi:gliding motility-associated-like protein
MTINTQQPTIETIADASINLGESIQLWGNAEPAFNNLTFQWQPATWLDCDTCQHPWATPYLPTYYTVMVVDSLGCSDTAAVNVFVNIDREVFIPNAFTPDGDGNNDYFMVYGKNIKSVELSVYNRWGEKVYESNDIAQGWDGLFKDNKLDPAVFVYIADVEFIDGFVSTYKGNVTLVR